MVEYAAGFGDLTGNHWLGLDHLARLTAAGPVQMHLEVEYFNNITLYALYNSFHVSNSSDEYRLTISGYSGTAPDQFISLNNRNFSTLDHDNDERVDKIYLIYNVGWCIAFYDTETGAYTCFKKAVMKLKPKFTGKNPFYGYTQYYILWCTLPFKCLC